MIGNAAVKKEVLPPHGWESASGKGRGSAVKMGGAAARAGAKPASYGSLSLSERERLGEEIVKKAAATAEKPLSRAKLEMWAAKILETYDRMGDHVY